MASLPSWLLWVGGVWLALYLIRLATVVKSLFDLVLRPATFEVESEDDVPVAWRSFLEARAPELERLQLVRRAFVRHRSYGDAASGPLRHGLLFSDESSELWVLLGLAESIDAREPHGLSVIATYQDGRWLHGINALDWAVLGVPPEVELVDPYAPSFEAMIAVLRARHAERRRTTTARVLEPSDVAAELGRLSAAVHGELPRSGRGRLLEDGSVRLHFGAAFAHGLRMRGASKRLRALARSRREYDGGRSEPRAVLPPELEVEAFLRFEAGSEGVPRRGRWIVAFLVTGAAFVASLLHWVEPEHTLVLAAVVLFHELGHYAAMRAFGYRDARIFFVPFFGAAAAGRKKEISLVEELVVLFAGPVPGIALALLLVTLVPLARTDPSMQFLLIALVGLNGFNLLPIYPLDGGKILDALLFARRPVLVLLFRGGAALLLGAGALWSSDPVLGFLAVIVALGLPSARQAAHVEREVWLERRRSEAVIDPLLLTIMVARRLGFAEGPPATRIALLRHVRERAARGKPSFAGTASWISIYGIALGASVVALMRLATPHEHDPMEVMLSKGRAVGCDRAREELDAAIAHVIPTGTSTETVLVTLRCELASNEVAEDVVDELAPLELSSNLAPVRPPWIASTSTAAHEESRARYTYAMITRAERTEAFSASAIERWLDAARDHGRDEGDVRRAIEMRDEKLAAWARAQAADPRFDLALAERLIAQPGFLHGQAERLGFVPATGARRTTPDAFLFFGASAHERMVTAFTRAQHRRAILGLAEHLCTRGCRALRYALSTSTSVDEDAFDP